MAVAPALGRPRRVGPVPRRFERMLPSTAHPQVSIDCNSAPAAGRGVSLVKSYAKTLVVDLAFVVEAKTTEELPEMVVGCGRLSHIDLDDAIPWFPAGK